MHYIFLFVHFLCPHSYLDWTLFRYILDICSKVATLDAILTKSLDVGIFRQHGGDREKLWFKYFIISF